MLLLAQYQQLVDYARVGLGLPRKETRIWPVFPGLCWAFEAGVSANVRLFLRVASS